MVLSCICSQFYILGLNRQILCRYRKKLYVFCECININTVEVHNLIKDIGDAAEPKWCKIGYFGENSKFCTHTETLFPNGQQHPKKGFLSE